MNQAQRTQQREEQREEQRQKQSVMHRLMALGRAAVAIHCARCGAVAPVDGTVVTPIGKVLCGGCAVTK